LLVIREGSYVMEEVLRELSDTELDAVSGGAAGAAVTTSGDVASAGANNTGPTAYGFVNATVIALGGGPSAVAAAS
jgi:hypothetical protein